jgi:hypothetical protein
MHFLPTSLMLLYAGTAALASVSTITVSATAPVAQPTSTSYTSDSSFQNDMLSATNFYRSEHGVAALTWNATSAKYALNWSSNCNFEHSVCFSSYLSPLPFPFGNKSSYQAKGGPTGENLAAGYPNASASVDAWGLERELYNWAKPGFSETTGHFTQLVWSNTTSVGCGRTSCQGKNSKLFIFSGKHSLTICIETPGWYVVCEYYPPGNVVGDNNQYFIDNVPKQVKGKKTDTVESGITSASSGWQDARWGVGVLGFAAVVGVGIVC